MPPQVLQQASQLLAALRWVMEITIANGDARVRDQLIFSSLIDPQQGLIDALQVTLSAPQ